MYNNGKQGNLGAKNKNYVDISSGKKLHKRKISWGKVLSAIFFSLVGICGIILIYAYTMLHSFNYQDIDTNPDIPQSSEEDSSLINDNMVLNVLLLGTDSQSAGDGGRTDTILILSLDARHKKLKVTSLMRDTWVKIPGYQKDRLNAAYAYGGVKLTLETIKYNFGVKIDRYALVDFDGFESIVDSIGGINLLLTSAEVEYINKNSGDNHYLKGSGEMRLSGKQALMHARNRDSLGSDYDRTERQRNVITAIVNKTKMLNIGQITKLISTLAPLVTTNFKAPEITILAKNSLSYLNFSIEQFRIPTDDNVHNETIDHKMVLVINDMKKAKNDILKFIYEDTIPQQ